MIGTQHSRSGKFNGQQKSRANHTNGLMQLWSGSLPRIFTWTPQNLAAPLGAEDFGLELHTTSSSFQPPWGRTADHETAIQKKIDDIMLRPHDNYSGAFVKARSNLWYIKQCVVRARKSEAATVWTWPAEVWHFPLMHTDRLSGRTSLSPREWLCSKGWRISKTSRQARMDS